MILDQYYNYFALNKLTLNESKTKYMIFSKHNKKCEANHDILKINDIIIERVFFYLKLLLHQYSAADTAS